MSGASVSSGGVVTQLWDDESKTYTDFRVTPAAVRPYTAAEQLEADARAAAATARATREAARAAVKLVITDLQAEKARVQAVIDKTNATITGADTKDVARAAKRIADAAIDLARLVQDMP